MLAYLYLAAAIIFEVTGTIALKSTAGFTKLAPTLIVFVSYSLSFYLLTLVLKFLPVSISYAIWSGLGIVLVTIAGMFMYKEIPDFYAILGMALIVAGVVVLNLLSKSSIH